MGNPQDNIEILLVDDDEVVRKPVTLLIEAMGYTVIQASGGQEGIETYFKQREEKGKPPVILTDLNMPRTDGIDVLNEVKNKYPDAIVYIYSGRGVKNIEDQMVQRGIEHKPDGMITKPIFFPELRAFLGQAEQKYMDLYKA